MEESQELIEELLIGSSPDALCSEIADVLITISHTVTAFNLNNDIPNIKLDKYKLAAALSRMSKETLKYINRCNGNTDELSSACSRVIGGLLNYVNENKLTENVQKHIREKVARTYKRNKLMEFNPKDNNWDELFLIMAYVMASASHCVSRQVGALIVKDRRIISTGINGTSEGSINCDALFPPKNEPEFDRAKHHEFSMANEIHAEMNAVLFNARNGGQSLQGATLYSTLQPCDQCMKNILQLGLCRIVYAEGYDFSSYSQIIKDSLSAKEIELVHKPIFNTIKAYVHLQNTLVKTPK